MADSDNNGGWSAVPSGTVPLAAQYANNDQLIQQKYPNWPAGGTAAQIGIESNGNQGAVSPKGATGIAQFMPSTFDAVSKQMGRKLDINNINDQMAAHRFLMMQNLDRTGGDNNAALSLYNSGRATPDNPETTNYVKNWDNKTGGWQASAPPPGADQGWQASAPPPSAAPSAAKQRAQDFLGQAKQNADNAVDQVQGAGENLLSGLTGTPELVADLARRGYNIATGQPNDTGLAGIHDFLNPMEYEPKTPQGQDFAKNFGDIFNKFQGGLEQGAQAALGAVPFIGEDLAKNQTAQDTAKLAADVVANVAPMMIGGERVTRPTGKEPLIKDTGAASELDKMNALYADQTTGPAPTPDQFVGPQPEGGGPLQGQPNAGPQRGAFIADNRGNVDTGLPLSDDQVHAARAVETIQRAQNPEAFNDMFPETLLDTSGQASPWGQVERDMVGAENQRPLTPEELERGGFPQENPQLGLNFDRPAGREIQSHVARMAETAPEQLDPASGIPHPEAAAAPVERPLAPDEFVNAVQTLAQRDPTKFSVPADMQRAFSHYQDIVSGVLDNPGEMAKRFAKAVSDQMAEDRVNNHPTIKSNQARVDRLQQALERAQGASGPTRQIQTQLDRATKTLEQSKKNIGKALGTDKQQLLPYEKDGAVNMYTFGHLPEMLRSIGALLKSLHGVVFRTLDKLPRGFSNLDSSGKIFAQGIRDKIAEQANRKWDTEQNEKPKQTLKGVPGLREGLKDYLPFEAREDLAPADLKQAMQQAPDLSAADKSFGAFMRDQFLTGQQLQAFTHHPMVKYAVETMDRAFRESARFVRTELMGRDGLRDSVRKLSDDEFANVWQLIQDNEGIREFNGDQMKRAGYSDKQIKVYQEMRRLDKMNLEALNRGRATAGLRPIEGRVAHIAGHFLGDFKRTIVDSDGKVRAVIAHNLRDGVETITKRVMEQLGEGYKPTPIEMRKLSEGNQANRYTGYMNILNDMMERDDVVKAVVEAYKDYQTSDGQAAMKHRAAYKQKEGVIGAEGRKSWQSTIANAKDGMKNFLRAQEAMNTWANVQEGLKKVSDFTSDPDINAPNAKAAVSRYIDNIQYRNQGPLNDGFNGMINAVSQATGVGPSILRNTSSIVKRNLLTWFIGLGKLSHSFVTMIQPIQAIPVVNSLMRAEGSKLGLTQLTSVAKSMGSMMEFSKMLTGGELKGFDKRAFDYARDNNTLNTTQFQFGNLTDINRSRLNAGLHTAAEFNVTGMETGTRAFTYMYYAHMLRDLGLPENEIFPTAHNAMRDVMVDYNAWERPGVFGKLGFLGDLTAMLTRYKFNQIDQFARATKYAKSGQFGPLATILTTSMLAAGVRGIMAYTIANSLVSNLTTWAAKNNLMQTPTSLDEMLLHMLHGKNQTWTDMVKFGLPAGLGLNMTGSLSHADDIPNDPLGALIPQGDPLMKYAQGLYGFLHDPNKQTAKNALYQLSPNSLRGAEENMMFTDKNGNYYDPQTGELRTRRDTAGQIVRNGGFRPLPEARESLTTEVAKEQANSQSEVRQDILNKVKRDIDSNNNQITPELRNTIQQRYAQKYLANGGDPNDIVKAINDHLGMGKNRTAAERAQGIPRGSLSQGLSYQRYEELK